MTPFRSARRAPRPSLRGLGAPARARLLQAMARRCDLAGLYENGFDPLAEDTGLGFEDVARGVAELVALGLIEALDARRFLVPTALVRRHSAQGRQP